MAKKSKIYERPLVLGAAAALLLVVFLVHRHFSPKVSKAPTATISQLRSTATPNDSSKTVAANDNAGSGQGIGEDTHGTDTNVSTPANQWTKSESGQITLKQPVADSTLSSGATISGSASVSQVYYRLIDDKTGVISQGVLDVVNGNFSGKVNFYSHGDSGRLDVYSLDSNGREVNEVQISVGF